MKQNNVKKLAKVSNVQLTLDRGCFLGLWVRLEYEGCGGQGFGGYILDTYDEVEKERVGTAAGADYIRSILVVFGVEDMSRIKGQTCYAIKENAKWGATIVGLEVPSFGGDDNKIFHIADWRYKWYPELYDKNGVEKENK